MRVSKLWQVKYFCKTLLFSIVLIKAIYDTAMLSGDILVMLGPLFSPKVSCLSSYSKYKSFTKPNECLHFEFIQNNTNTALRLAGNVELKMMLYYILHCHTLHWLTQIHTSVHIMIFLCTQNILKCSVTQCMLFFAPWSALLCFSGKNWSFILILD